MRRFTVTAMNGMQISAPRLGDLARAMRGMKFVKRR